jgi:hypothetical protein
LLVVALVVEYVSQRLGRRLSGKRDVGWWMFFWTAQGMS